MSTIDQATAARALAKLLADPEPLRLELDKVTALMLAQSLCLAMKHPGHRQLDWHGRLRPMMEKIFAAIADGDPDVLALAAANLDGPMDDAAARAEAPTACEGCGCTEDRPCDPRCFWVAPGQCSECWLKELYRAALALGDEDRWQFVGRMLVWIGEVRATIGGAPREAMDVVDAIGEAAHGAAGVEDAFDDLDRPRIWVPGDDL